MQGHRYGGVSVCPFGVIRRVCLSRLSADRLAQLFQTEWTWFSRSAFPLFSVPEPSLGAPSRSILQRRAARSRVAPRTCVVGLECGRVVCHRLRIALGPDKTDPTGEEGHTVFLPHDGNVVINAASAVATMLAMDPTPPEKNAEAALFRDTRPGKLCYA